LPYSIVGHFLFIFSRSFTKLNDFHIWINIIFITRSNAPALVVNCVDTEPSVMRCDSATSFIVLKWDFELDGA
jgi:hypothetical protein